MNPVNSQYDNKKIVPCYFSLNCCDDESGIYQKSIGLILLLDICS